MLRLWHSNLLNWEKKDWQETWAFSLLFLNEVQKKIKDSRISITGD